MQNSSLKSHQAEQNAINWLYDVMQAHDVPKFDIYQLRIDNTRQRLGLKAKGSPVYYCEAKKTGLNVRFNTLAHGGITEQKFFKYSENENYIAPIAPRPTPQSQKTPPKNLDRLKNLQREYDAIKTNATSNTYLAKKGVMTAVEFCHGLKFTQNKILLPLRNIKNEFIGFQEINSDGSKYIHVNEKGKKAAFAVICDSPSIEEHLKKNAGLWLAEGLSTALSVFEAWRIAHKKIPTCVIIALDAGNLEHVAIALNKEYGKKAVALFAADNDAWHKKTGELKALKSENTGMFAAHKIAMKMNKWRVIAPPISSGCTDFNDMHKKHGIEAVAAHLKEHKKADANYAYALKAKDIKPNQLRYLEPITEFDGIHCMKSPIGTGKTTALKEIVKNSDSAIYIAQLVSLIDSSSEKLGLFNYLDTDKKSYRDISKLGICLNSIIHLSNEEGINAPELLVIDEIEQVINRLCDSTLKNKHDILKALIYLINNSKNVILLDADLGKATYNFLAKITTRPIKKTINNFNIGQDRKAIFYNDLVELKQHVNNALANNERVFLSTNSRAESVILHNYLASENLDKKGLLINSENKDDPAQKAFIADPNGQAKLYDFIVVSPTVNTGVSIDSVDGVAAFDFVAGYFKADIYNVTDAIQAIGRVRDSAKVHLFIEQKIHAPARSIQDITASFMNNQGEAIRHGFNSSISAETGKTLIDFESAYTSMKALNVNQREWSKHNFYAGMSRELVQRGYEIVYMAELDVKNKEYEKTKVKTKASKEKTEEQRVIDVCSARDIDLNENIKLTAGKQCDSDALSKYRIKDFYRETLPTLKDAVEFDKKGQTQRKLNKLKVALVDDNELHKLHEWQECKMTADKQNFDAMRKFRQQLLTCFDLLNTDIDNDGNDIYQLNDDIRGLELGNANALEFVKKVMVNHDAYKIVCSKPNSGHETRWLGEQLAMLGIKTERVDRVRYIDMQHVKIISTVLFNQKTPCADISQLYCNEAKEKISQPVNDGSLLRRNTKGRYEIEEIAEKGRVCTNLVQKSWNVIRSTRLLFASKDKITAKKYILTLAIDECEQAARGITLEYCS